MTKEPGRLTLPDMHALCLREWGVRWRQQFRYCCSSENRSPSQRRRDGGCGPRLIVRRGAVFRSALRPCVTDGVWPSNGAYFVLPLAEVGLSIPADRARAALGICYALGSKQTSLGSYYYRRARQLFYVVHDGVSPSHVLIDSWPFCSPAAKIQRKSILLNSSGLIGLSLRSSTDIAVPCSFQS